jgi:hypothetical protein
VQLSNVSDVALAHLHQRLCGHARTRWPQLTDVWVSHRAGFAHIPAWLTDQPAQDSCGTFKEPAVNPASGSKPERETAIEDANVLLTVLTALGVEHTVCSRNDA